MSTTRAPRTRILGAVGAVLLLLGVTVIVMGIVGQKHAPQPPASAAVPVQVIPSADPIVSSTPPTNASKARTTSTTPAQPPPPSSSLPPAGSTTSTGPATRKPSVVPSQTPGRVPATRGPVLPRSLPLHLSVPAIGVESDLRQIGLDSSGAIQTPPLVQDSHAYWLTVSPTPGQLGPATIIGHVDSAAYGPGVFFKLGDLRQRDKISITRADHTVAVFEVERVVEYPKKEFPTQAVYGNTDHAALRLITCGGTFDPSIKSYESNIVVYAALVSVHAA
ncbi:Sortase family protein [Nakamurella panacisegetis]|uniref:Sortase family protein n=1 Tax=Nakamurella panacisegetis TaxID=1090615 RepID=A0A1H0SZF9_9ACTN|nr:class F sortase [Nakamurella panacisegetis]SDP47223.1 Sortase family protein [Nakamurella panacisegetis]